MEKVPDFFLYTTLNQNQTKDLCKARTNIQQRIHLQEIFGLKAIDLTAGEKPIPLDQIILDFHFINLQFCNQKQYSNEKISTLLGIMDYLIHAIVKNELTNKQGQSIFQDILYRHTLHRPPFRISVFTEEEKTTITNFMLRTFFRHLSLYEHSFKPNVDLLLVTEIPRPQTVMESNHDKQSSLHDRA